MCTYTHSHVCAPHTQTFVDYLVNIGWEVIKFCKSFIFQKSSNICYTKFLMWCNHQVISPFKQNGEMWVPLTSQIFLFQLRIEYNFKCNSEANYFFISKYVHFHEVPCHYLSSFYFYCTWECVALKKLKLSILFLLSIK